jgi:ribonuclease BN (tRNA processing enzyme)
LVYQDENVTVEARHNYHLQDPDAAEFTSYSFRILAEGKKIVYSGDVRKYTDMGDWLDDCDLLMMETGHHKASEVCAGLRADNCGVKDIIFVHSGRELLNDYEGALSRAEAAWGKKLRAALDAETFEI